MFSLEFVRSAPCNSTLCRGIVLTCSSVVLYAVLWIGRLRVTLQELVGIEPNLEEHFFALLRALHKCLFVFFLRCECYVSVAANFENIILCDCSESSVHCSSEYCEFVPAQLSVFLVGTPIKWCNHFGEQG